MTEREQFEVWMLNEEKCIVGSSDPYPAGIERRNWRVWHFAWQASRRAALEEAADLCDQLWNRYGDADECADAIRALSQEKYGE